MLYFEKWHIPFGLIKEYGIAVDLAYICMTSLTFFVNSKCLTIMN